MGHGDKRQPDVNRFSSFPSWMTILLNLSS